MGMVRDGGENWVTGHRNPRNPGMGLQCANRRPDGTDMLKSCTHGLPSGLTGPRRMLVHAAVLLLALSLLSPATGLQGAGRQGCTAFVSRNIVQSVFTLLPPVRLHLNRHRPENTEAHGLHRSPPRGGGGVQNSCPETFNVSLLYSVALLNVRMHDVRDDRRNERGLCPTAGRSGQDSVSLCH